MLIAQISDCHIVAPGQLLADRVDSAAGLRAAVEVVNALDPQPDLVLATGDLVNDGTDAQYDHLVDLLGDLRAPVVAFPGNHDDRSQLRRRFDGLPAGGPDEPIDHVIDDHAVRIVALDTSIPGRNDGQLTSAQLAWLDRRLASAPDRPTVVAQHHPPMPSGVAWMDETCGFAGGEAEAAVVAKHPQVAAVLSGHLHRSYQQRFGGTIAVTCPSTASQLALELVGTAPRYTTEPTGLLLHHWCDEVGLTSHMVPIGRFERWLPPWAE